MENQNIPWEAISAYLKNEADSIPKEKVELWLNKSLDNQELLKEIIHIWGVTKKQETFYSPDLEKNWEKLKAKTDIKETPVYQLNRVFKWAVAVALIPFVFWAGMKFGTHATPEQERITYTKIIAPEGNKTQILLPDSSRVWLNSGSELTYASNFSALNRKVEMKGECYFDILKNPESPFTVSAEQMKVIVYGTKFNVNEELVNNRANITLVSGIVNVYNKKDKFLSELKPGEQISFNDGKYYLRSPENIDAITSWINNMLIVDNQPFEELIQYLEKWYGVKITLDKSLYYQHNYTFKIRTESLREVLELISFITPIDYEIDGDNVKIKHKKQS